MSENSIIQMYGTADTDASAVIDVPDDGVILGIELNAMSTGNAADADYSEVQISFSSVSQFVTNDARGVLAHLGISTELVGTGANALLTMNQQIFYYGDGIKVFGGERLYMHILSSGQTISRCHALLLFNFKNFVQRRR